ncbi:4-alpha-glucanotransferase [uncultured Sphingomonas sp.]|uniref:4-alpha-glucanotransferase n=1 Tax=uncultured Sphingomonas sp. TaxID=158754 RepID=UPI0025F09EB8|nr:4-alpha-glucanotransferase [uncultured Sphingomonas sp.]
MSDAAVARLATAAGLLIDWEDASGVQRRVSPESLRALLTGLGFPCGSEAQCRESMERLRHDAGEPCRVIDSGTALTGLTGRAKLHLKDGGTRDLDLATAPRVDTLGYHRLEHAGGETSVIVAPQRCRELPAGQRLWGTAAQIHALRGAGPFGDFATLADYIGHAAKAGAEAVMMSPVHALFTTDPSRYSPYSPSSRRFLNPWLADAGEGWHDPVRAYLIDWPSAVAAKLAVLRTNFAVRQDDPAFRAYVDAADPALIDHARFEALHAHFLRTDGARGWQDWPEAYRRPNAPAVADFARDHAGEVRFHLFLQWCAETSLARAAMAADGMRVGLVTDIAVGLDAGGSHAWSRGDELMLGIGIGAPPDAFQEAGQNWGITSFSPFALRTKAYRPFIELLRSTMQHAGGIRIDHALGLRRLWVVPTGASPLDGAYLRQDEDDLLRLIALESVRSGALVIGEDLGVVPPGFRDAIGDRGLLGMRVLPFERTKDGDFTQSSTWDAQAVAMTSTHDLPPIAGWWKGCDITWRERIGTPGDRDADRKDRARDRKRLWQACIEADAAEGAEPAPDAPDAAVDAAVGFTAAAPSVLAIIPAEDLFATDEAPNLPGTVDEHPNWRRRLPDTADALFARADVARRIDQLNRSRHA